MEDDFKYSLSLYLIELNTLTGITTRFSQIKHDFAQMGLIYIATSKYTAI